MESQRAMTEQERSVLEKLLRDAPARWKIGLGHAVVLWAVSMMIFVLSWGAIGWLARVVAGIEIGWKSSVSLWLPPVAAVVCALYAIYSAVRWLRPSRENSRLIRRDLAEGKVFEETLRFAEAKVFQEPEHDGLIYFLRTTDDRVFARTLNARFIVSQTFAGDELPGSPARELRASVKKWPQPEEFCSVPWNELETVYG